MCTYRVQSSVRTKMQNENKVKNGTIAEDGENMIPSGKLATRALHDVMWNKNRIKQTKKRIFTSIIERITL